MKPDQETAENCQTVSELQQNRPKVIFCEILLWNGEQIPGPWLPSEQEDFIYVFPISPAKLPCTETSPEI